MSELEDSTKLQLQALNEALNSGTFKQVRKMLNGLAPADVAHLIESSPPKTREVLWALIDEESEGDVLQHLSEEVRSQFLNRMDTEELVAISESLDTDDLADVLQDLPGTVIQEVLQSMSIQDRQRVEAVLNFPEDTAGGLMNTDTITVRPNVTLEVVLRYLQSRGEMPASTDQLFVVSRTDDFLGTLPITTLLTQPSHMTVGQVMEESAEAIEPTSPETEVAQRFERHDLISAAVVDEDGKLLGRITIDDVVDVIRQSADHSFMSMAGLDEEADTFAPVFTSTKRRAIWLGVNLLTAILASYVIGLFEATIQQVVALAILMPIVASMGGIAGSQTLTLVIRGMALGQISWTNARWLLSKEMAVATLNGLLWSLVVATLAAFWFQSPMLGYIIAAAMIINLLVAAFSGALIPMILKKMSIDPAVAGGVVLTTVTDVVGFFTFLGLASLFLI